jgi:hypothetical protein
MVFIYCSVTTPYQSLEAQEKELIKRNTAEDYKVVRSDLNDTTALSSLVQTLQEGDTLYITDILKLADKSAIKIDTIFSTVINNYEKIFASGADLIITESEYLNSKIYKNAIFSVPGNEKEYEIASFAVTNALHSQIRQTIESILSKQGSKKTSIKNSTNLNSKRGFTNKGKRYHITKEKYAKEYILSNLIDFGGTLTNEEIIKGYPLSRGTFFKYKKQLLAEQDPFKTSEMVPDESVQANPEQPILTEVEKVKTEVLIDNTKTEESITVEPHKEEIIEDITPQKDVEKLDQKTQTNETFVKKDASTNNNSKKNVLETNQMSLFDFLN